MARLLGDHALARTRSDRLYELQFDHIQLMRAYALTLERETRKDPLNREELLRLKRIIEHNASSSSQHLNALAIAQVLEYGEDEGTSQW